MPTVVAYHDVKDTDHWLASPKREEFFGPLGVTNIRTFVDPAEPQPGRAADGHPRHGRRDGRDADRAAAEAMAHDGVLPETLVILVEA